MATALEVVGGPRTTVATLLENAGGLGGFFPPLVMASVWSLTGSSTPGFVLLSLTAVLCLAVAAWPMRPVRPGVRTPVRG